MDLNDTFSEFSWNLAIECGFERYIFSFHEIWLLNMDLNHAFSESFHEIWQLKQNLNPTFSEFISWNLAVESIFERCIFRGFSWNLVIEVYLNHIFSTKTNLLGILANKMHQWFAFLCEWVKNISFSWFHDVYSMLCLSTPKTRKIK
jgi:hypothetical protein